jgi:hypothetical protein
MSEPIRNPSKFQLFSALAEQGQSWINLPKFGRVILCSVEREDGSGHNFNLTIRVPNADGLTFFHQTAFVRTID